MTEQRRQQLSTILAFALLPISGFATDIYIPSLPSMGNSLHVNSVQVQLTLTLFLISYGVSQLFIGSFLDSFGRYKPALYALLIFTLASLVIALTKNIYVICLMRVIHGISVAVIVVAKRAYFVDVYEGDRLKHYLSMFTIIWSAGPIIAPFIGGYLEHLFGWQSNFWFLSGLTAIIGLLDWIYGYETLHSPVPFHVETIGRIYASMIKTTSFTLGILMLSLAYAMVMVYNMTGPFIIEHSMGFTPVIAGYCSLLMGLAWMSGGFIGRAVIKRPLIPKMLTNIFVQFGLASTMGGIFVFSSNLTTMLLFAFLIHTCAGFTYNNYFTYCLSKFPQFAGISGGITGGAVYILVSILSYSAVSLFPPKDTGNLSYSYAALASLSLIVMISIYYQGRGRSSKESSGVKS